MPANNIPSQPSAKENGTRLEFLDSIRGLMALWVMFGHLSSAVGATIPLVRQHPTGVDVFIILSGFLMVYNYNLRRADEPWEETGTWRRFWVRRFFRIAPVYYVCYLAVVLLGSLYSQWQHSLVARFHHEWMIDPLAPDSKVVWNHGVSSILAHVTFLFGLFPSQAVTSPLPDWSLGLEAEYYAVFPLIMLFWKRGKWLMLAVGAYAVAVISRRLFGLGLGAGGTTALLPYLFPMPSFLGFRIPVFLIGMLLAEAVFRARNAEAGQTAILMALAGVLCGLEDNRTLMLLFAGLTVCVFAGAERSGIAQGLNRVLEMRAFRFLGEISYPVYLTHQLVILPVCAVMIRNAWVADLQPGLRFLLCLSVIAPLVVCLSYLLHRYIETPGILAGKRLLRGKARTA